MNVAVTGTTPTPFGFAGQHGYQNDSVTGLMRLGHRYYDASVGRFLSRDPIQDGYNWYAYVNNDPVNSIDPEGWQQEGNKIPDADLLYRPIKSGRPPIGKDGKAVELHHRNQNPMGPIDEMTRDDHRGPGNHGKNHPLPNQGVDHDDKDWKKWVRDYWKKQWESGRFLDLPVQPSIPGIPPIWFLIPIPSRYAPSAPIWT